MEKSREHVLPGDYKNYYFTSDIDVASTLICKGYALIKITPLNQMKATFVFKNHPALEDVVNGFWNNRIEVNPLEFATIRKNLKSRVYAMPKSY